MQQLFSLIRKVAPVDCNVLVQGESGTGKALVAFALHNLSPRRDQPFVTFNCGGFTEELISSELFGYEKGAFTGAAAGKTGLLEAADGGTVFLDEVGEMPLSMQVRLLHVLQDRRILRVGGTRPVNLDIRIIAATNRDLKAEVEKGNFREDLFFRLNVVSTTLPRLAERKEDIPLLVRHFIEKYRLAFRKEVYEMDEQAMAALMGYSFPGNVRELENIVERAMVYCHLLVHGKRYAELYGLTEYAVGLTRNADLAQNMNYVLPQVYHGIYLAVANARENRKARAMYNAQLSFAVPGSVYAIGVKPGQSVKKGDLLMNLDSRAEDSRLALLDSEIASTIKVRTLETKIVQAKLDMERFADALRHKAATAMLLLFAPVPYIDVSSSVQIRSRWARAAIGLAGVYCELFLAFAATLLWAHTAEDTSLHQLARNCVIITSVTTLLFNVNPLMRFDGYFVFSDLLALPNLYQRSQAYAIYLFKKYALGVDKALSVVRRKNEKLLYPLYALAAFIYRIVITVSIFM